MRRHNLRAILAGTTAISGMVVYSGITFAQETQPRSDAGTQTGLTEIVVTAQRRGENLQDVPLSVSALSADELARVGITSAQDLQLVDPSLNITGHSGSVLPFMRGIGNPSATTIGNEASVPLYIDEVYYTRVSPAYLELANIQRIEVLKGPQGTLFGRNASGGLIHIITRDPSMTDSAFDVTAGYSNFDTFTGKFYGSTPITERIAADLSVSGRHQGEGWGRNQTTGADTYKDEFISVRAKLAMDLTPSTQIRLSGFYSNQDSTKVNLQTRYRGTVGGTPAFYGPIQPRPSLADSGRIYDTINDVDAIDEFESWGVGLKITQGLGFADLVSITSYRSADESWTVEGDGTEFDYAAYYAPSIDRQATQELQLKSLGDSSFDWILGAFYLYSKQGYTPISITGDQVGLLGLSSQELYGVQRINSYSAYGQATFHLIPDKTNLTLGLRYTSDEVHGVGEVSGVIPSVGALVFASYDDTFDFNKLTYRVALDQRLTDDILGYVSVSRGYKSGTFNTLPLTADPSNPEIIDAYELGFKTELFNRRLRLNVALFQNDISDPQVQTVIPGPAGTSFVGLTNADAARARGVEVELDASVTNELTLRLGGSVLDAKYTDFKNGPVAFPIVDAQGNPTSPYGLHPLTTQDESGYRIAQVPKHRVTGGLNYDTDTAAAGRFNADVNVSYTSEFPWEPDGIIRQEAYTLVGASLQWTPPSQDQLSIRLWGKNLTDKKYYVTQLAIAGSQQGNNAIAAEPRTYGIEARYEF